MDLLIWGGEKMNKNEVRVTTVQLDIEKIEVSAETAVGYWLKNKKGGDCLEKLK